MPSERISGRGCERRERARPGRGASRPGHSSRDTSTTPASSVRMSKPRLRKTAIIRGLSVVVTAAMFRTPHSRAMLEAVVREDAAEPLVLPGVL